MKITLPKRQLQQHASVKELAKSALVKINGNNRSRYYGNDDTEAMPTNVVSNSMARIYYAPTEKYWEEASELETTPWLPKSATEITKNGKTIPITDMVKFEIARHTTNSSTFNQDNKDHVPKPGSVPAAYVSWTKPYDVKENEITPKYALFLKEDCIQINKSKKGQAGNLAISRGDNEKQINSMMLDKRFEVVDANNYSVTFAVVGELSAAEWEEFDKYPIPGSKNPCGVGRVVDKREFTEVEIPESLELAIKPEWFFDGKFYISIETALKLIPKYGTQLKTPAPWVTDLKPNQRRWNQREQTLSVDLEDLAKSDMRLAKAQWSRTDVSFDIADITSWPSVPLKAQIYGISGFISDSPPDASKWKRVNKGTEPSEVYYLYPHAGVKGYKQVSVVDTSKVEADAAAREALAEKYGADFEEKYIEYAGAFHNTPEYAAAVAYVAKHDVCLPPSFVKCPPAVKGFNFSRLEDAYKALGKVVPADSYMHKEEILLTYLYFRTSGESQKLVFKLLKKECESSAEIITRFEKLHPAQRVPESSLEPEPAPAPGDEASMSSL